MQKQDQGQVQDQEQEPNWSENHIQIVVEVLKCHPQPLHQVITRPEIPSYHKIVVIANLLKSGISPDIQNKYGNTALHLAMWDAYFNIDIIKVLLDYGADFKKRNVLELCKRKQNGIGRDVLELILSKMNNVNSQDPNKKPIQITLEDCVICNGHREEIFTLYPCGHAKTCEMCCVKLIASPDIQSVCPICRTRIDDYKKIYV